MTDDSADDTERSGGRISVNIVAATKASIDRMVEREGITQTEALRRLISYGDLIYTTTQIDQHDILIRRQEGSVERIVMI